MMLLFIFLAVGIAAMYALSWKKYAGFVEPVDRSRYILKPVFCVGLYMLDKAGYRFAIGYDRFLLAKIIELSGPKYCQFHLKIHLANKLVMLLLVLIVGIFLGAVSRIDGSYAIFMLSVLAAVFYFTDRELDERLKKRRSDIRLDFPDFLNKLVLLINTGMTVSRAWERAVTDSRKTGVLYEELTCVISDVRGGKPEQKAYEDFAKRCRTPEITRFVSVILQNLRKGSNEIVPILRVHANECWEIRKNTARKLGEEASTRLLLPMMLMFLAILLIVGAPAVLALRGI